MVFNDRQLLSLPCCYTFDHKNLELCGVFFSSGDQIFHTRPKSTQRVPQNVRLHNMFILFNHTMSNCSGHCVTTRVNVMVYMCMFA